MATPVTPVLPAGVPSAPAAPRPKNVLEAAQQFEALLIEQLLKGARGDGQGWLGTGDDAEDSTEAELAEQQFAQAIAKGGGLGLSNRIAASLSGTGRPPESSEAPALRGVVRSGVER